MMKLIPVLLLALALTACSSVSATVAPGIAPVPVELAPAETVSYAVELETRADASRAEDGTPLVSYCYQVPVLRAERADGTRIKTAETETEREALAVTEAFNQRFEGWNGAEELGELTQEARADLDWRGQEGLPWNGYQLELDCTVYQTERLVSVSGVYVSYTGGAHSNAWLLGWNFDLELGAFFEPEYLAEGAELQEAVTAEIIRQAHEPAEDGTVPADSYWEDYQEIAANWSTAAVSFDEAGMTVGFSPYEMAAYSYGAQTFQMSYAWLEPHLGPQGRTLLLEPPQS